MAFPTVKENITRTAAKFAIWIIHPLSPMDERCNGEKACYSSAAVLEPPHSCLGDKFVLDDWWYDKRPKRCYISDETPPKWYYNPSGDTPKDIIGGTPVCREVRYKDGDEDANTCPEHYESIMNEYECRTAANCLNDRAYDEFRYLSEAEQNAAPKGCHKTAKDSDAKGDVRFNNMSAIPDHADPSAPKGQPICQKSA